MAPYQYPPTNANPYGQSIAELMLRSGDIAAQRARDVAEIQARARAASGQIWGQAVQGIGANVGQSLGAITDPNRELTRLKVDEAKRNVSFRDAFAGVLKATPQVDEDGVSVYNVRAVAGRLAELGHGDQLPPVTQALEQLNASFRNERAAKMALVKQGAEHVALTGNDPIFAGLFLDQLEKNQVFPSDEIAKYREVASTPEGVAKLTAALRGPVKYERGAPGSMSVDPLTGKPVEGSAIAEKEDKATLAVKAAKGDAIAMKAIEFFDSRQVNLTREQLAMNAAGGDQKAKLALDMLDKSTTEANRHNLEMEKIQNLQVGREQARDSEIRRHNQAVEDAANPLASLLRGGGPAGGAPVPAAPGGAPGAPAGAPGGAPAGGPASSATPGAAVLPPPAVNMQELATLHGPEFLAKLPPALQSEVRAYAEGRRPFPAGFALKSPYFQTLIQLVGQYDPTFDAANYNARNKARTDFVSTNGNAGKQINALNTAIGHLDELATAAEALKNGNIQGYNAVSNRLMTAFGWTGKTDFDTIAPKVADEVERLWRGSGGSEGSIERTLGSLNTNMGPDQLRSAISKTGKLIESKLEALEQQRDQALGPFGKDINVIFPKSRSTLSRLEGSTRPAAAAPAAPTVRQPAQVGEQRMFDTGDGPKLRTWDGNKWVLPPNPEPVR